MFWETVSDELEFVYNKQNPRESHKKHQIKYWLGTRCVNGNIKIY